MIELKRDKKERLYDIERRAQRNALQENRTVVFSFEGEKHRISPEVAKKALSFKNIGIEIQVLSREAEKKRVERERLLEKIGVEREFALRMYPDQRF